MMEIHQLTDEEKAIIIKAFTCTHCGVFDEFSDYGMAEVAQDIHVVANNGRPHYGDTHVIETSEILAHYCKACETDAPIGQMSDQQELILMDMTQPIDVTLLNLDY